MLKTLCGPLGPGVVAVGSDAVSPCFSSLVLDSVPVAILLVYLWPQCRSICRRHRTISFSDPTASYWIQMVSCLLMTIFPIVTLLVRLIKVDPEDLYSYIYPYELIAQLAQFAAWLCGAFLVSFANAYGAPLNYGIRLWWITNFIISCKDVQSQGIRTTEGKDFNLLLIISCTRLFVSAVLAADSIFSLKWILRKFSRVRLGHTLQSRDHPWLQTTTNSLPDSQIWNTWLACDTPSIPAQNPNSIPIDVNALNLISWFEGVDSNGQSYVQLSIEVEPTGIGERSWIFSSSFADWVWLGHAVKQACILKKQNFDLPEFPSVIKHCSVAESASILQLYLQYAVEYPNIQALLVSFLGSQIRLQYADKDPCETSSFDEPCNLKHVENIQHTEQRPKLFESRLNDVRQKINEVISTPIAVFLDRQIRAPSAEVLLFQTSDSYEKITEAGVIQYNKDLRPVAYDILVSTRLEKWTVSRHFNQFLDLHTKLQQLFDNRLLPSLPSKSLLTSSLHADFLEHRRRQLDIFIQSLVNVNYFECRPLYDFLSSDSKECYECGERNGRTIPEPVHKFDINLGKWQFSDSNDNCFNPIYYIEVYEYFSSNQYLKWTIRSTLYDIKELHSSLRRRFPNDALPDMPNWSSAQASGYSPRADALALQLELFLQKLINCTPFCCPEINAFLELDNGSRHISTGMHNVVLP